MDGVHALGGGIGQGMQMAIGALLLRTGRHGSFVSWGTVGSRLISEN